MKKESSYFYFLLHGVNPDQITRLTFLEKATVICKWIVSHFKLIAYNDISPHPVVGLIPITTFCSTFMSLHFERAWH